MSTGHQSDNRTQMSADVHVPSPSEDPAQEGGKVLGEVCKYQDDEHPKTPHRCFTVEGINGHFTCEYRGPTEWTTADGVRVSGHGWTCTHSGTARGVAVVARKVTGSSLAALLPGTPFLTAQGDPDGLTCTSNTYAVTNDVAPPPAVLIEALEATSDQRHFQQFDFTQRICGPYEAVLSGWEVNYHFNECQESLAVFGTQTMIDNAEHGSNTESNSDAQSGGQGDALLPCPCTLL